MAFSAFGSQSTAIYFFFFFNDTATTEIYTLSLHDALPICAIDEIGRWVKKTRDATFVEKDSRGRTVNRCEGIARSEEHTSELQSQSNLVCRLLLEKKKKQQLQQAQII